MWDLASKPQASPQTEGTMTAGHRATCQMSSNSQCFLFAKDVLLKHLKFLLQNVSLSSLPTHIHS